MSTVAMLRPEFFLSVDLQNPPSVIFQKVEEKKYFFFILSTDSKYYFVSLKKIIYFGGSVCVFLRVTLLKVIVLCRNV